MTIATTSSRVDYMGDGVSTAFAVPFPFFGQDELRVIERVVATGAETVLTLGGNYTVSGGNGATGTVTAVVAPANTRQWTILRATKRTQEVDYQPNDPFPAETHERALDRVVALVQENERDAARGLRVAETDAAPSLTLPGSVERANRVLGFDATGNPVPVVPDTGGLVVTPYAQTLLDDTSAAQARDTLGMGSVLGFIYHGFLMPSLRASAPTGWLLCYGQAVSRTTYALLWAALGSPNTGDGSTTFTLPDLRGRALFGKDDMGGSAASRVTSGVSGVAGSTLGAVGGDQRMQQHQHGVNDPGHFHTVLQYGTQYSVGAGEFSAAWASQIAAQTDAKFTGVTIQNAGDGASQNMPPAAIVNWLIYAGV